MDFENVRVVKKANVYFDGNVTSRAIYLDQGEKKTLGFMLAGEYEFSTAAEELMEVLGGEMEVLVKGAKEFTTYQEGSSFVVPADSNFQLKVKQYADYCCSYKEAK